MTKPGIDSCLDCGQAIGEDSHFCPACERPTFHATPDERARWELRQWYRARGSSPDGSAMPPLGGPPREVPRVGRSLVERLTRPAPERPPAAEAAGERPEPDEPTRPDDDRRAVGLEFLSLLEEAQGGASAARIEPEPIEPERIETERIEPDRVEPERSERWGAPEPVPAAASLPGPSLEVVRDEDETPADRPGSWGDREVGFARQILHPGGIVIDAGAGLGWFTDVCAAAVGPAGTVIAIEPSRARTAYLRRNFEVMECVRVVPALPTAVGDPDEAPIRSLDAILADLRIQGVDLLRIDLGGAVPAALEGAKALFASRRFEGPVMLHIDRHALADAGHTIEDVLAYFPGEEWADTTGLRLGLYEPDEIQHTRIFERR